MRRRALRWLISAAGLLVGSSAQAEWKYDPENMIAWGTERAFHIVADCDDNEIVVSYSMPRDQIADQLATRERAYLIIGIDEQEGKPLNYFSVNSRFLDNVDRRFIGFSGKHAVRMARDFTEAEDNITVGVSVKKPTGSYNKYNTIRFPVDGAEHAVRQMLKDCGLE
jgi:hypothetical protein